jgi:YesN/AraC family two-component response regulator
MSKLLVVEDVAAMRQHIVGLIQSKIAGAHEIHEATNGAEGLKLFRALSPEMIVMDISMPELNGIKAAQQIWAESPKDENLVLVAVSSRGLRPRVRQNRAG